MSKLLLLGVIIAIGLFAWAEQQRRSVGKRLEQTEQQLQQVQGSSTERSGEEVALDVLQKVRRHISIPLEPEPTVATIVDVETLRQSSDFYNQAENGDHLIVTPTRAILYDPDQDIILDVVPVQIDQQPAASPGASPEGAPAQQPPAEQPPADTAAPPPAAPPAAPVQ